MTELQHVRATSALGLCLTLLAFFAIGWPSGQSNAGTIPRTVAGSARDRDKPVCTSGSYNPSPEGGTLKVPHFAAYDGRFGYAGNNVRKPRMTLTLVNCGETNFFGAPTPSPSVPEGRLGRAHGSPPQPSLQNGSPMLYLAAVIDGAARLDFVPGTLKARLRSVHFVPGSNYIMYLYSGDQPLGTIHLGAASVNHVVTFVSPLAGVSIVGKTPLFMEVVGPGALGTR